MQRLQELVRIHRMVVKVPHCGWAYTTLPEYTRASYAAVIADLDITLVHQLKPVLIITPPSNPPADGETPTKGGDDEDNSTTLS